METIKSMTAEIKARGQLTILKKIREATFGGRRGGFDPPCGGLHPCDAEEA